MMPPFLQMPFIRIHGGCQDHEIRFSNSFNGIRDIAIDGPELNRSLEILDPPSDTDNGVSKLSLLEHQSQGAADKADSDDGHLLKMVRHGQWEELSREGSGEIAFIHFLSVFNLSPLDFAADSLGDFL